MGNWLGTNGGKQIDLNNPLPSQVSLDDIACALSKLCRFNGQLHTFYSVAEHCLNVAALVPEKYKLQALLHDASEAYICDIPTPLKRELGNVYYDVEYRVQDAIGKHFNVKITELSDVVKHADRVMLCTEHDALQDDPLDWGPDYEGVLRYPEFTPLAKRFPTTVDRHAVVADLYKDAVIKQLEKHHAHA